MSKYNLLIRRLKRNKRQFIISLLLAFLLIYLFRQTLLIAGRDFLYLTRPIWDSQDAPENITAHFYAPNLPQLTRCSLHGWTVRESPPRVIDAFIFSNELDILEIRLRELWDVVDTFVIVEADKTFTGKGKPLFFNESKTRFSWAEEKIAHFIVTDLSSNPVKPFESEARTRGHLTKFVKSLHPTPRNGDLVIEGDTDELPSRHTIELLRSCKGYPPELHLELQNYLYSFEFRLQTTNWRPHVATYDPKTFFYHHGRKTSFVLADAGWHCSFCFRHISDFTFKMTAYSHSERVTRTELLKEENIRRKICEGLDIYDMLPEVYTFKDLILQWGKVPRTASTVGIPEYIVQNPTNFHFLLPGGCVREDSEQR